jgi:secreted PhoX family phosphatase
VNSGAGGTSELAGNGAGITSSADTGANAAVAIDNAGNVWSVGTGPLVKETTQVGAAQNTITSGGGLNTPAGVAIDGNGQVWVTDGSGALSLFSNSASVISPSGGIMDPTLLSTPGGIAVDLGGSVWIANTGNNSVTRILGVAGPVAPLTTAAANGTTGAKP